MNTLQIARRLLLGLTLTGALSACNPDDGGDAPPAPPTPAPTVSLAAAPASLTLGASATLTWSSTNATACTASGAWSGSRATSGSEANTPAATGTSTYTLTCTGTGGSGSATATVTVVAPPAPTVSLTAVPSSIIQGAATNLTWSSTNATACTASGNWTGSRGPSGTEANTPTAAGPASYTLTCTGPGGSGSATAAVTVNAPSTVSISAAPTTITLGSASTLTWTSTSTSTCTASGDWSGTRATSGSEAVTPTATGLRNYTLTCTGAGGSATGTASVQVNPIPTVSLGANPATIIIGASSTLTWSSTNATSCNATGAWTGSRGTSGSETVTPTATGQSVYGLSCTGAGGTVTQTAAVQVNPVPTATLTFNGRAVSGGNSFAGQTDDGGLNDAAVSISIGTRSFAGTADGLGNFSIAVTLPVTERDALVRIQATGTATQSNVIFAALLPSFATLQTQAGDDRVLTATENFRVNVTNLSTAEVALASEAAARQRAGGNVQAPRPGPRTGPTRSSDRTPVSSVVATEAELVDALMTIDTAELLDVAVSLSLIADRGVALPNGVPDTLTLALDADVRQQFIADLRSDPANNTLLAATLEDLLADRSVVAGATVASITGERIAANTGGSTEENLIGNGALRDAFHFVFNADGSGRYTGGNFFSNALSWTINPAGAIEISFAQNPTYNDTISIPDETSPTGSSNVTCRYEQPSITVMPLSQMSAVVRARTVRDCGNSVDFSFDATVNDTLLFVAPSQLPPFNAAMVSGQTLAITLSSPPQATGTGDPFGSAGDLVTFNADGTGTTRFLNLTLTWVDNGNGSITARYSNGISSTYRVLRQVFDGGLMTTQVHETASGYRYITPYPIFTTNNDLTFTAQNVVGTQYQGGIGSVTRFEFVDFQRPATEAEASMLKGFFIELFASGNYLTQSDLLVTDTNGNVVRQVPTSTANATGRVWRILPNGSLVLRRYVRPGGAISACTFDNAEPSCILVDQREVFPYFLHGDRKGWFERRRFYDFATGLPDGPEAFLNRYYVSRPNGDIQLPREGSAPFRAASNSRSGTSVAPSKQAPKRTPHGIGDSRP